MKTPQLDQIIGNGLYKPLGIALLTILLIFCFSCRKDDKQADIKGSYRVKSFSVTTTGMFISPITFESTNSGNFVYDLNGNRISESDSYSAIYSDGKTSISSNSANNQYNLDGFLIHSATQFESNDRSSITSNGSSEVDYVYLNGLLIKASYSTIDNGITNNYQYVYEYDGQKIIKISNNYDDTSTRYEYINGKLSGITKVDAKGLSTSPFFELTSQGWVSRITETQGSNTYESRRQYDSEGNITREEKWINGIPNSAWDYEYDRNKSIYTILYPKAKGHPVSPEDIPYPYPTHNYTKTTKYKSDTSGNWEVEAKIVFTNTYSLSDYPEIVLMKMFDKDGKENNSNLIKYVLENY